MANQTTHQGMLKRITPEWIDEELKRIGYKPFTEQDLKELCDPDADFGDEFLEWLDKVRHRTPEAR